ncbi:hypothetical protein PMEGAPR185_06130 [Priestia megaterium]
MLDEVKNEPFINHVDEWFVFRLDSTRYVLASFYFASSYKKGESALFPVWLLNFLAKA